MKEIVAKNERELKVNWENPVSSLYYSDSPEHISKLIANWYTENWDKKCLMIFYVVCADKINNCAKSASTILLTLFTI